MEQEFHDALVALIEGYRNRINKASVSKILHAQGDIVERDETWTRDDSTPPEPALTSLSPNTAVANAPDDFVMSAIGSGFTSQSQIFFNGLPEPTTMVSDTELTTGVKPSLFEVPAVCPVEIRTGTLVTGAVDFTFTAPVEDTKTRRR